MKINLERPLWAMALIGVLFLFLWQCEGRKADKLQAELDNRHLSEQAERLQAEINDSTARLNELRSERVSEHLEFEASRTRLMQSVDHWKGEARKVRPVVVQMSDSIPVLKAYIAATDSVIAGQDSVIAVQELHLKAQSKLYEMEIGVMGQRHVQAMELVDVWRTAAVDREKELKREQRPLSFAITSGPGILVSPDGSIHAGFGANVGLSFKIRFRKK